MWHLGGLVGTNEGVIINCYSISDITGGYNVGGLVGANNSGATIINCYSAGKVRGNMPPLWLGGLVGSNGGTVTESFWDTETSGQSGSSGGAGKTTEEMQTQSTFANWDFITPVWTICEWVDYPRLLKKDAKYGGGSGTADDPYLIYTPCQMQETGTEPNDWDKQFKLMADIDVGRYTGEEFNIIGTDSNRFTGIFDGNGHTISNFTYSIAGVGGPGSIAMFGSVDGASAEIKNLGLVDPNIEANVWFYVAPLVGQLKDGIVSNCYAIGGDVSGMWYGAGLVGSNQGTISKCMSSVSVVGDDFTGGLVGANYGAVTNCYTTGTVTGDNIAGGLVGLENDDGTVDDCYACGSVSGISDIGGLVGLQIGGVVTVTNSFWDVNTSGLGVSDGGTPKTTAEMQIASTFTSAGWDFDNIWKICEDVSYPKLRREKYTQGVGTLSDPYLICSAEEMQTIGANPSDWDKHFKLMADIDLSSYTGTQFNIIGSFIPPFPFTGSFDGNRHVISNFTYNATEGDYIGLFGMVGQTDAIADIKNLGLKNPQIDVGTGNNVGALAGLWYKGGLSDCYIEGGSVDGNSTIGGLIGRNFYGDLSNCYSSASISGIEAVGGLLGTNFTGIISNCYSFGSVSGGLYVGGLIGINNFGTITDCYSQGDVTGTEAYAGGLTGINEGTIVNCYSAGIVDGNNSPGGLTGYNSGDVNNSFWDVNSSNQSSAVGLGDPCGISGKTTAEMQMESTFTNWDFNTPIWEICEGTNYPKLAWQIPLAGDFACPDGVEINDVAVLYEQWLLEKLSMDTVPNEGDGTVNLLDWATFADGWQNTTGTDDMIVFVEQWLSVGAYCADIAPEPDGDGMVDGLDFAALANNWLEGI